MNTFSGNTIESCDKKYQATQAKSCHSDGSSRLQHQTLPRKIEFIRQSGYLMQ
ncbi:hypothetical protein ABF220_001521 [Yersinia ruckeri]|uniref:Uncharacterized protein n=1 Tax=Yersinia ruckeri TaxID=29486 RepID=A0A0A8VAX8_YERRU|nr:hypothetical protein yruck0001_20770 [Yersinia ruckeri ATCC 29473]MCW6570983.1 hypothetical protein [Yersinia ruckeri]CEK26907.1 hypothetical protein CSF007_5730 [Yersinia ruckeri]